MQHIKTEQFTSESNVIGDLLELTGSTTVYLEMLRNNKLKVQMLSQKDDGTTITRVTKLYFSFSEQPLIYSVSTIHKNALNEQEYDLIAAEEMPLGRIFIQLNSIAAISKTNISVNQEGYMQESKLMDLSGEPLYRKQYDFLVSNRKVARIEEFFNLESVQRY